MVSAFWEPGTDAIQTGTLTVNERDIAFTTAPEYRRGDAVAPVPSNPFDKGVPARLSVFHGFTEEGLCTLCDLIEVDHPGLTDYGLGQSIAAITYQATICVTGLHLGGTRDKCLNSARYTFTGLSDWLPKATREAWEEGQIILTVPLKERDILSFSLRESRVQISLKVFSQLTSSATDGARLSKSVAYVEVENPVSECLSWYLDMGNRLENLFSLLTGTSLALETLFVYRGDESGTVITKLNNRVRRFDLRECVRCTPSQLANSIATWLSESREFRSVENLALGVVRKGKLFVETQFLSLAQALEGIHRVTGHTTVVNRAAFRQVRKKIAALLKRENVDSALTERIYASRLTGLCQRLSGSLLVHMQIDPEQFVAESLLPETFTHMRAAEHEDAKSGIPFRCRSYSY